MTTVEESQDFGHYVTWSFLILNQVVVGYPVLLCDFLLQGLQDGRELCGYVVTREGVDVDNDWCSMGECCWCYLHFNHWLW